MAAVLLRKAEHPFILAHIGQNKNGSLSRIVTVEGERHRGDIVKVCGVMVILSYHARYIHSQLSHNPYRSVNAPGYGLWSVGFEEYAKISFKKLQNEIEKKI